MKKNSIIMDKSDVEALLILAKRGLFKEGEVSEQARASYDMLIDDIELMIGGNKNG